MKKLLQFRFPVWSIPLALAFPLEAALIDLWQRSSLLIWMIVCLTAAGCGVYLMRLQPLDSENTSSFDQNWVKQAFVISIPAILRVRYPSGSLASLDRDVRYRPTLCQLWQQINTRGAQETANDQAYEQVYKAMQCSE